MKKVIICIFTITIFLLQACSGGSSGSTDVEQVQTPDDTPVDPLVKYTLNISIISGNGTVNPSGSSPYSKNTDVVITATPAEGWQFDHWSGDASGNENPLTITMGEDKNISAVFTLINTDPVQPSENIDIEQSKAVLYAAYAGIGYMDKDDKNDDELLYRVMFRDINDLAGNYVANAILYFIINWNKDSFDYTVQGSKAHFETLSGKILDLINPNAEIHFKISASISSKVTSNEVEYSGSNSNDLVIEGIILGAAKFQGATVTIKSFTVTAGNTLKAVYSSPSKRTVKYSNLKISYFLNQNAVNCFLLPDGGLTSQNQSETKKDTTPDLRHYSINGGFNIDEGNYFFDMTYSQIDMKKINPLSSTLYISMKGKVSTPGINGYAEINVPCFDAMKSYLTDESGLYILVIDNIKDAITKNSYGVFTSGTMTLDGKSSSTEAVFNSNGSVNIGNAVTVNSWQYSLDPLK
jgi:hypothetical protein